MHSDTHTKNKKTKQNKTKQNKKHQTNKQTNKKREFISEFSILVQNNDFQISLPLKEDNDETAF